ncbi:MAG: glycosyltransferase [Candidatus Paceibacterota bacterium]|jgi:glycosyltransferase involved in cell wall biosynthesis
MAPQENNQRVTAVVSAYNEAPRIEAVLQVLTTYPGFAEIIVIDDGSTDDTAEIAKAFIRTSNVRMNVVQNDRNMGKGYSMDRGVKLAHTEIIFFSDADITGLTHKAIDEVIAPVLGGHLDMMIGMSDRRWYVMHEMLTFVPLLGGERAITRSLWQKLPEYYKQHFRIEVALNFYSVYYGQGYKYKILDGVSQTIKEEKYGWWRGAWARLKMFYNIFSSQLRLNFRHTPHFVREGRWHALVALYGMAGTVLGILFFIAIYFGPSEFIRYVFAEKLRDPGALLAPLLLDFANFTPINKIALLGLLIFISSISIFILTRKNLNFLLYGFIYKLKNGKHGKRL